MAMTREEALTIVASIVREHSRGCREPKPCQDCELEAEAIAALSAQADTKQAEPVRVSREQLSAAWRAGLAATDKGCADWADEMLAALHQLGAKVEVSDG